MKHWTQGEWERYVGGLMSAADRAAAEQHLYVCEMCLEIYMECLDEASDRLPQLVDQEAFTEAVMEKVAGHQVRRRLLFQRPFIQYVVAAAITIIFMSTGLFEKMSTEFNQLQASQKVQQDSVSGKLVERTVAILDRVQPEANNGGMFK